MFCRELENFVIIYVVCRELENFVIIYVVLWQIGKCRNLRVFGANFFGVKFVSVLFNSLFPSLASDWNELTLDWHRIGAGLTSDWPWIGKRLTSCWDGLVLDWRWIDTGLGWNGS